MGNPSSGGVLFVTHVHSPRLGWLEEWAHRAYGGFRLVKAQDGRLPSPDSVQTPVIIMGGPMGVGDLDAIPWLRRERQWISALIRQDARMLGICLGAQMIAYCLGHRVDPCPNGAVEVGYHPLLSQHGLPPSAYQWHRDGITLNSADLNGVQCLGTSSWRKGSTTQAFRRGRILGVQFHPEVDEHSIRHWLQRDATDLTGPYAQLGDGQIADHAQYATGVRTWLEKELDSLWGISRQTLPAFP